MPPDEAPNPARISLRDVARAVGVSHVTVSLALRGDPRVSAARRIEVEAAAKKMGYRPDPMLASLSAYRHAKRRGPVPSTIAWLNQWPDPRALRRFHEFAAYWRGAKEAGAILGYGLEEFVIAGEMHGDRLQRILSTRNIRGILLPPHAQGFSLPGFDWNLFSAVRFGVSVEEPRAHVVVCNQGDGTALAFAQAHAYGYVRIGFVSSLQFDHRTRGYFRAGYLRQQADLCPLSRQLRPLLLDDSHNQAASVTQLCEWLRRERPDAVITSQPNLQSLLTKLGLRVPHDLAVAATSVLDGNFSAGLDQNCHEIGAVAMRTLAGLIHQNERGVPQFCRRILVEGRWVDGSSLPKRPAPDRNGGRKIKPTA